VLGGGARFFSSSEGEPLRSR